MSLLVDLVELTPAETDTVLESIYKSRHDPPDDDLWRPHQSAFVREIIEAFSALGVGRMSAVLEDLKKWAKGGFYQTGKTSRRPAAGAAAAVWQKYFIGKPVEEYDADDWIRLVDWLTARYWSVDQIVADAERLAVQACVMGGLQRYLPQLTEAQATALLAAIPGTVEGAVARGMLPAAQRAALAFARARVSENITGLTDVMRHRVKTILLPHMESQAAGDPAASASALEQKLFDAFSSLNRDWRRIAITEMGEFANRALIASCPLGTKLRRIEKYPRRCAHCRSVDEREFTVVSASKPNKDGETEVWPGKDNIGRSAALHRRVGNRLVEREAHERLWVPEGLMHPNCRGTWQVVGAPPAAPDWTRSILEKA